MSENGFMAMIKKNPVTTGIVTFAVLSILIIVIVMIKMAKKNTTPKPTMKEGFSFSDTFALSNISDEDADHIGLGTGYQNEYEDNEYQNNDYENEIVENFPQPAPMNVMYSDANGNLATTTDLGLQNLTIAGGKDAALLIGNKFRFNANKDFYGDDKWLRMSNAENTGYAGNGADGGFAAQNLYAADNIYAQTANIRGNSTVAGDAVVGGKLSINGWGNVRDTLSDIYARIDTLIGRVNTVEGRTDTLKGRADTLDAGVARNSSSITSLSASDANFETWCYDEGYELCYVRYNRKHQYRFGPGKCTSALQLPRSAL